MEIWNGRKNLFRSKRRNKFSKTFANKRKFEDCDHKARKCHHKYSILPHKYSR